VVGENRKKVEAFVPARIRSSGLVARTSITQLQKSSSGIWPRISSANALQKERQGRVNGGLARIEDRRVKPTVRGASERYVVIRPHRSDGRGPEKDPGWRESVIQRSSHRQKRCDGRGTGAVTATGSYEGSLPIEGIPDHQQASAFTRRRQRWSRRSSHPPTRTNPLKKQAYGQEEAAPGKLGEA
jgi:hypothetical protein